MAVRVAKQLAVGMPGHEASRDRERRLGQVNDAQSCLALRLREDPSFVGQVDVTGLDSEGLLRPAAGLPGDNQQIAEVAVLRVVENFAELFWRDDELAPASGRFPHICNRRLVDQPLFLCPPHGPFDCPNGDPPRSIRPAAMHINPLLDVKGPQLFDRENGRDCWNEFLQPIPIPLIRGWRTVDLAMLEELVR